MYFVYFFIVASERVSPVLCSILFENLNGTPEHIDGSGSPA
jgi:hypothetical protein